VLLSQHIDHVGLEPGEVSFRTAYDRNDLAGNMLSFLDPG